MAQNEQEVIDGCSALEDEALQRLNAWNTMYAQMVENARVAVVTGRQARAYADGYVPGAPGVPITPDDGLAPYAVFLGGVYSSARYQAAINRFGSIEGIEYKFGPGPTFYGTDKASFPTLFKNPDQSLDVISVGYPANAGIRNTRPCNLGYCGTWQVGGPPKPGEGGTYSSNMGTALFISNNPNAGPQQGSIGAADLTVWSCGENVASTRPELPWVYYGEGLDSINQAYYKAQGLQTVKPVCIARGDGRPGWGIASGVCYANGLIAFSGQNTGNNKAWVQLAANKVPVSACMTNGHEFMLVLVWDKVTEKSEVAVIPLAGTPQGAYLGTNPAGWESYRGEWRGVFPGLPNYGNISYAKVVGYFDTGMRCATSISATFAWDWQNYAPFEGAFDLRVSATRARFRLGGDREPYVPKHGVIAVSSREEKRLAFFDMTAILQYYRAQYFQEPGIGVVGNGAGQWPPTFAEYPGQTPTLIRAFDLQEKPNCLRLTRYKDNVRCYVATQPGNLQIWGMGGYPAVSGGNPSNIAMLGSVVVGRNPVDIGLVTRHAGDTNQQAYFGTKVYPNADFDKEIIVSSRGDRRAEWVRFNSDYTGGSVIRVAKDSRLKDLMSARDGDNHTTESYILTCSDLSGQVYNFRYGPVIYWWNEGVMSDDPTNPISFKWTASLPPNGSPVTTTTFLGVTYAVECAGLFTLPGFVFAGEYANVF